MRKIVSFFSMVCVSAIIFVACSKDNEEDQNNSGNGGGGNNSCDTVNMKYAANVKPILESNCYGCHGSGVANGGVKLDTYSDVKAVADNGKLIGAITHATGYSPMPKGASKLADCSINKIKSWVDRGAPNN